MKKLLLYLLVASLPLETWVEMPIEIKKLTMQYIGYVFCTQIEPACEVAEITFLIDEEEVKFDVVCLKKKTEI